MTRRAYRSARWRRETFAVATVGVVRAAGFELPVDDVEAMRQARLVPAAASRQASMGG